MTLPVASVADAVRERTLIDALTRGLPRSRSQLNGIHQADAELLRLPGAEGVLAVTTDAIVEEIATGLYGDPELIGWMTVAANASDLAAVGAEPLGVLLSYTLPPNLDVARLDGIRRGVAAAARAHGLPVLGGDTNTGGALQTGATALGWIASGRPLTRVGCVPGDLVYSSGAAGLGSAFALARVRDRAAPPFRPMARLAEGRFLREVATACIDTSDGLLVALDELARVNHCGFALDLEVAEYLHPCAAAAVGSGVAAWMLLAGPHGDFELVFTVPLNRARAFEAEAMHLGWTPCRLGRVTRSDVTLRVDGEVCRIDGTSLRNAAALAADDTDSYVEALEHCASRRLGG